MSADYKPNLIILSGPLGIGKSTLAKTYSQRQPLALNLDLDLLRDNLGQWRENRSIGDRARKLAWDLAEAMAEVVISAGSDVIFAHAIRQIDHFRRFERLAAKTNANLVEVLLFAPKDEAVERFLVRGRQSGFAAGYRAGGLIDRLGGIEWVEAVYDQTIAVARSRPQTIIIEPKVDQLEATCRELLSATRRVGADSPESGPG